MQFPAVFEVIIAQGVFQKAARGVPEAFQIFPVKYFLAKQCSQGLSYQTKMPHRTGFPADAAVCFLLPRYLRQIQQLFYRQRK